MENIKVTRENIGDHLFNRQLEIVGKSETVTVDDDKWRFNNTMTRTQLESFEKESIKLIQKTFRCSKNKAKDTFEWFRMRFGLRIKG